MTVTLEDACTRIVDCEHRTSPIDSAGEYFAVGTPAMRGNVIDYAESRQISRETFVKWTRRLTPRFGDLLFAREAPVGPIVMIPKSANVAPGQRTVLLRPNPTVVNSAYLFYLLASPVQQSRIASTASGSTVAHLNVADVRSFKLPQLPSVREQQRVAEVLRALDDKIAANARLGSVADELVRSMYARFGSAGDTKTIGDLARHPRDLVDPSSSLPTVRYVGLEHVPRRSMWLDGSGTAESVTSTKAAFVRGDVLFGKLRPYFHKVVSAPSHGICSTDILVLRPLDVALSGFLLAAAASDYTVQRCTASSEGTRMPRASWKDLAAVSVPWPGHHEAQSFSETVDAIRVRVDAAITESVALAETRDALLPLLMSGKIRVKDAEGVVEGAV